MPKIPERFIWATELLQINASDNILEIGCGAGLLAEQINRKLDSGRFLGIDKSSRQLNKAAQRNQTYIQQGIAQFIGSDFLAAELPAASLDKVVAFNVNFFWKNPVQELIAIKKALKWNGSLYVFYQAPYEIDLQAATPIVERLEENFFNVVHTQCQKLSPTAAICIVTRTIAFN